MLAPKKVLIVEDEFILYDELAEFFIEKGFRIAGNNGINKAVNNYEDAIKILHDEEPDLAVLDIQIKGNKDGLEIGSYIKQHYNIPIIILSAHDNYENLERAKILSADAFVVKIDKPVNKKQLWADVIRLMPKIDQSIKHRTEGRFMKVKEIDITQLEKKHKTTQERPADPLEIETYIKWNEIKMIISSNKISNNNLLIYKHKYNKGYFYRSTLNELELLLPDYFARFNQSTIVNLHAVTAKGKSSNLYYLDDVRTDISETYKQTAQQKGLYLSNKF